MGRREGWGGGRRRYGSMKTMQCFFYYMCHISELVNTDNIVNSVN